MVYIDFIDRYCEKYKLELRRERRTNGERLIKLQMLIYLLRMKFNISYQKIADNLCVGRQSAMHHYYVILGYSTHRKIAEARYREIVEDVRDVQENDRSKTNID